MRLWIVLLALLVSAPPAFAFDTSKLAQGGSLPLDDTAIQALIGQSSKLAGEIDHAVAKTGKKPAEIICDGKRFSNAWKELSGRRVSPYHCQIGDKWLTIRANVRVFDAKGKLYQSINQKGMEQADTVKENHPTWTWSDKESARP
jgi:hypothetical protein